MNRKRVKNTTSEYRKDVYAVVIGINQYRDQNIPDLKFARADAEEFYNVLIHSEFGKISRNNIILLTDEQATMRNIKTAIGKEIRCRAESKDSVIIFYAGHGAPEMDTDSNSDNMKKYLVPTEAELDNLQATGIAMSEIQMFLKRFVAKQVFFFIDSCYSGIAGGRTFQSPHFQTRAIQKNDFLYNMGGEGRFIMTACDVNEVSIEVPKLKHGLFSYYLIKGLKGFADRDKDGLVTIDELYDYIFENVKRDASKFGGSMSPLKTGQVKGKIYLTRYETKEQKQAKNFHLKAISHYQAGRYNQAFKLWQQVIKLFPGHKGAMQGLKNIDRIRRDEAIKKQQLEMNRTGKRNRKQIVVSFLVVLLIVVTILVVFPMRNEVVQLANRLYWEFIESKDQHPVPHQSLEEKPVDITVDSSVKPNEIPNIIIKTKEDSLRERIEQLQDTLSKKDSITKVIKEGINKHDSVIRELESKHLKSSRPEKSKSTKPGKISMMRSRPLRQLSLSEAEEMLKKNNFFDRSKNNQGKGISHRYEKMTNKGQNLVVDRATNLIWQQTGSKKIMDYKQARAHVAELNSIEFGGFNDWRLPTLEEAMSLMERDKNKKDLFINERFDQAKTWIWTGDKQNPNNAWRVAFDDGLCQAVSVDLKFYVRAVRSKKGTTKN